MPIKAKITPLHLLKSEGYNAAVERENNVIGKRISEKRRSLSLSLSNLSEILSVHGVEIRPTSISKWEVGDSIPSSYQLVALCKALNIDTPDYFTAAGVVSDLNEIGMKKVADYKADLIASGKYAPRTYAANIVYIDMPVSYLPASAGTGAFLDEGNFEMVSFPKDSVPDGAEFGIRVSGDSMMPVYNDGQIVWVQECKEIRPGEVGIFIYDGDGYIKVYDEQEPDNPDEFTDSYGVRHMQPVMISYNQAYAPKVVSPNAKFQIVGRVLK